MFSANQPDVQTMKCHLVQKAELTVFLTSPFSKVALARIFFLMLVTLQIRVIQLHLELSTNVRNLSTSSYTLFMPTFLVLIWTFNPTFLM